MTTKRSTVHIVRWFNEDELDLIRKELKCKDDTIPILALQDWIHDLIGSRLESMGAPGKPQKRAQVVDIAASRDGYKSSQETDTAESRELEPTIDTEPATDTPQKGLSVALMCLSKDHDDKFEWRVAVVPKESMGTLADNLSKVFASSPVFIGSYSIPDEAKEALRKLTLKKRVHVKVVAVESTWEEATNN